MVGCLLVYFNLRCSLMVWCQEEILLLDVIQEPLGEEGDASTAPLQCFDTTNRDQRQNESVLVYQHSPMTAGKLWSGIQTGCGLCCPAKCPLYDLLVHRHQQLTVVKTHSPRLRRGRIWGWGTLLDSRICPSCACSPVFSSSSKTREQQCCVLQPHRV